MREKIPDELTWVDLRCEPEQEFALWRWLEDQPEALFLRSIRPMRVCLARPELATSLLARLPLGSGQLSSPHARPTLESQELRWRRCNQQASGGSFYVDLQVRVEPGESGWTELSGPELQGEALDYWVAVWPHLQSGMRYGTLAGHGSLAPEGVSLRILEFGYHPVDCKPYQYGLTLALGLAELMRDSGLP